MVILVPILFVGFLLFLVWILVFLDSPGYQVLKQRAFDYDYSTIWELITYVPTLIVFGFACFVSIGFYQAYVRIYETSWTATSAPSAVKLFGIATSFALVVAPVFGITILVAAWSFGFMSVGFLELFGWVSITFYSFSLHSIITSILFYGDYLSLDALGFASIGFALFFFVIGFLISLFATMPPWYLVLTSSLIG